MRSSVVALFLSSFLCRQDDVEGEVRRLVDRLDDDSMETRNEAAAELSDIGQSMLLILRESLKNAQGERRARLQEIVRKLENRERVASAYHPATRITLRLRDHGLRDAFAQLAKSSPTPLDYEKVPESARVTVDLVRVPFWQALDQVCKSSGEVMYLVQETKVILNPRKYEDRPKAFWGPFMVLLTRITKGEEDAEEPTRPGAGVAAFVQLCWEGGIRPDRITCDPPEGQDDLRFELAPGSTHLIYVRKGSISHLSNNYLGRVSKQANRLDRFTLPGSFEFAVDWSSVNLKLEGEDLPISAECDQFRVTLSSIKQSSLEIEMGVVFKPTDEKRKLARWDTAVLKDAQGKEHGGYLMREDAPNTHRLRFLGSKLPTDRGSLKEIILRAPKELHVEQARFTFKDVKLK